MSLQDMFKESRYRDNGWARLYCGIHGHSFILRLCRMWNEGSLYNSLYILGRSSQIRRSISHQPSSDFRPVRALLTMTSALSRSGKMMSRQLRLNNHELMHALINIVEEFHRQGVRRVVFGSLFLRHQSLYNKIG